MHTFNTDNPENMIWQNEEFQFTVLGGIRLEGLDRMRVTLKVEIPESKTPPLRHNLDLYNDLQSEKFARKIAERLEIGMSITTIALSDLTAELEHYRLKELKALEDKTTTTYQMTEGERTAALDFLSGGELLDRTNELIGKSGILGEEVNRLIMYLIFTTRKRSNPLHVVSLGSSGTGKTHLQERVAELIPEEDRIEITTLTENAFYYFERNALAHKLVVIEDLDGLSAGASGTGGGGGGSLYALRELQSKKRISKTVAVKNNRGQTRTTQLVVEGPVCVAGCTTRESIYEDNANRSFLLYLDESPEQDQRVMDYQRAISAGKIDQGSEQQAVQLLRNCQRLLEPVKVVNPYAELLHIPVEVFKPRRTNTHYLQFIEAVTFYHQKQRALKIDSHSGSEYIETTIGDIEAANRLLKHVLLRKSDQLTGACRNHFESLKLYLIGEQKKEFSNQQIAQLFRKPITTVKRHHLELTLAGYLKTHKVKGSKAYVFSVASYEEYQQLQTRIQSVLDECLETVRNHMPEEEKPKGRQKPGTKSGPLKPTPAQG